MKSNLKIILILLITNFFVAPNIMSQEIFSFNVTNIEISENLIAMCQKAKMKML